jgi:hypothetical protein
MLWERCLAMAFILRKPSSPCQSTNPNLSGPRGALQREVSNVPIAADHRIGSPPQRHTAASHSINSSARNRISRLMFKPRTRAVLRLITSSNLTGCSIGNSAGLVPFRTFST